MSLYTQTRKKAQEFLDTEEQGNVIKRGIEFLTRNARTRKHMRALVYGLADPTMTTPCLHASEKGETIAVNVAEKLIVRLPDTRAWWGTSVDEKTTLELIDVKKGRALTVRRLNSVGMDMRVREIDLTKAKRQEFRAAFDALATLAVEKAPVETVSSFRAWRHRL